MSGLALLLACQEPRPVAPIEPADIRDMDTGPPRTPVRMEHASHGFDGRTLALTVGGHVLTLPAAWFEQTFGDAAPALTARDFGATTTVVVGDDRWLVHLFAYAIGGGSMNGAAGRDVWVLVNGTEVTRVLSSEEPTMWRLRQSLDPNLPWAETHTYLLADVDHDGLLDLGTVIEEAYYVGGARLEQEPVRWSLARDGFVGAREGPAPATVGAVEVPRPWIRWTATEFIVNHSQAPVKLVGDDFWNPMPREPRPTLFEGGPARISGRSAR